MLDYRVVEDYIELFEEQIRPIRKKVSAVERY
jgi:hypothetical protein